MASTVQAAGTTRGTGTFDTLSPATSEVIATFPVCGEQDVADAVARARVAGAWWA